MFAADDFATRRAFLSTLLGVIAAVAAGLAFPWVRRSGTNDVSSSSGPWGPWGASSWQRARWIACPAHLESPLDEGGTQGAHTSDTGAHGDTREGGHVGRSLASEGCDWAFSGMTRVRLPSGALYAINATGLGVWLLCDGRRSGADLVTEVQRRAGIDAERSQRDVQRFLATMVKAGLVKPV